VLLIALSGPSYVGIYGSPPASPPPTFTPPPTIPFIPTTIPFIPSEVFNCGGSVESCKQEGWNSGSILAKNLLIKS
jgi:hypothetical protein